MIPYLNINQVNLLSSILVKELYNYDLIKKNTDITNYSNSNINEVNMIIWHNDLKLYTKDIKARFNNLTEED